MNTSTIKQIHPFRSSYHTRALVHTMSPFYSPIPIFCSTRCVTPMWINIPWPLPLNQELKTRKVLVRKYEDSWNNPSVNRWPDILLPISPFSSPPSFSLIAYVRWSQLLPRIFNDTTSRSSPSTSSNHNLGAILPLEVECLYIKLMIITIEQFSK